MAANLGGTSRWIASGLGKRVANWILPSAAGRRNLSGSAYDKNPDDQVQPSAVPEDVIKPESDKYWGPNPATGVFGPAAENGSGGSGGTDRVRTSAASSGSSALDQTAWFRPLEDVQKPPPQP